MGVNMQVRANFTVKAKEELEVGELIKLNTPQGVRFAVVVHDARNGVGGFYLSEKDEADAFRIRYGVPAPVMSYGKDWILEVVESQEMQFGSGDDSCFGCLFMTQDATTMVAHSISHDDEMLLDTCDWAAYGDYSSRKVVVKSWRIWASDDHFSRTGAKPLLEFKAQSKTKPYALAAPVVVDTN